MVVRLGAKMDGAPESGRSVAPTWPFVGKENSEESGSDTAVIALDGAGLAGAGNKPFLFLARSDQNQTD